MKIDAFYVNAMKVEEDFAYHQVVQAKVTHLPLTESATGYSVGLKTAADAYNKAVEELDKVLESSKSIPAALDAAKKDAARDKSWYLMRNFVKASVGHPDAEVNEIMVEALRHFDKYGDLMRATQMEESGRLHNLLEDLRGMGTTKLAKAGLTPYFNDLEQKNKAFVDALNVRVDEKGERLNLGLIQKRRKETDEAYRRLVEVTNALVVINGEAPYLAFVKPVNALINEMRATLANRRTTAATRKKKNPKDPKTPKDPKDPKDPKTPKDPKDPKPKKPGKDDGSPDIHLPEEEGPKKPGGGEGESGKKPEGGGTGGTGGGDSGDPDIHLPEN